MNIQIFKFSQAEHFYAHIWRWFQKLKLLAADEIVNSKKIF